MTLRCVVLLRLAAVLLFAPATVQAAARVFVSVSGVDMGNCSDVNAPCRTLDFAINAVDAGGEVIVLSTGSYAGATISKSVKVNAPAGIVAFSASPITIVAGATDVVVIRGLTIKALSPGVGTGINFLLGGALYVENCVIDGWEKAISFSGTNASLFVTDTVARNQTSHTVVVGGGTSTVTASIDRSRFENGGSGGCGVVAEDGARVSVAQSVSSSSGYGFCTLVLSGGAAELNVKDSLIANNSSAGIGCPGPGGTIRAAHNIVTNNFVGFSQSSSCTFESLGDNLVRGNSFDTFGTITVISGN
jgi:hypothetical protein